MALYQNVQKNLAFMGYSPNERPFNRKHMEIILAMAMCSSSEFIYLMQVANTPKEYMIAIFFVSTSILILIAFLSTAHKLKIFFVLIDKVQIAVNGSK